MKRRSENGELRTKNGKCFVFHFPLSVLFLLLLVSSCISKKKLVGPVPSYQNYEWMTAKMNMDLNIQGVEYNNVSGSIRMRRDSAIWVSAAVLGMEMVRVLLTSDSVVMVNRSDKTYLAEPFSVVSSEWQLPPTLHESQMLLLGDGGDQPVEFQFGPYAAKIRYSDIQWNEPTTFPIKLNQSYERIIL